MPPAASKREVILEYLRSTVLRQIQEGPAYNLTVATVERGRRNPVSLGEHEFPALFIASTHEKRKNLNQVHFGATLEVVIVGYVKNTSAMEGGDGTGTQKDLDRLMQDVVAALESDPLMGGDKDVKWIEVTEITTDDGDLTPYGGFVLSVSIEYAAGRKLP